MITSFVQRFSALSKVGKIAIILIAFAGLSVGASALSREAEVTTDNSPRPPEIADVKKESTDEKVETLSFSKKTVESDSLPKGVSNVTTQGVSGSKTVRYKVITTNGIETSRTVVDEKVIPPVDEITTVGIYEEPSNCDPNYTPCVPNVSYDLDCSDIGFSVRVIGSDPHRFDRDHDGFGCESY